MRAEDLERERRKEQKLSTGSAEGEIHHESSSGVVDYEDEESQDARGEEF